MNKIKLVKEGSSSTDNGFAVLFDNPMELFAILSGENPKLTEKSATYDDFSKWNHSQNSTLIREACEFLIYAIEQDVPTFKGVVVFDEYDRAIQISVDKEEW